MSDADKRAEQHAAEDAARAMQAELQAEEEADREAADSEDVDGMPGGTPDYEAVIRALQDDLDQARDQRLRGVAEMENLRRRTAREVADARKFAVSGFARDLLSVSDNLTRALSVVSEDEKSAASQVWQNLLEGIVMTGRELDAVLERNGVKQIVPMGERFDPNQHQAMFEVPDPSKASGTVVQVVAPGYLIGDRVLRPAMVGVARGGPKIARGDAGQADPAAPAHPGETVDRSA